jgi:hypothetical protein
VLSENDFQQLIAFPFKNRDLFATPLKEIPPAKLPPFHIDTMDALPTRAEPFRHPPKHRQEISRQVSELLEADIIEESSSPWRSDVVLVKKHSSRNSQKFTNAEKSQNPANSKNFQESYRLCIDFRSFELLLRRCKQHIYQLLRKCMTSLVNNNQ